MANNRVLQIVSSPTEGGELQTFIVDRINNFLRSFLLLVRGQGCNRLKPIEHAVIITVYPHLFILFYFLRPTVGKFGLKFSVLPSLKREKVQFFSPL